MQERIELGRLGRLWLERIAWHAAATAVLALMIVVLLCSLQWLDRIDPNVARARAEGRPSSAETEESASGARPTEIARVHGPSG